jgi:hypothetical protein
MFTAIRYLLYAFKFLRYFVSPAYRKETHYRWSRTDKVEVVAEIIGGLLGWFLIGFVIYLLIKHQQQTGH